MVFADRPHTPTAIAYALPKPDRAPRVLPEGRNYRCRRLSDMDVLITL